MKFNSDQKKLFRKNRKLFQKCFPNLLTFIDASWPANVQLWEEDSDLDLVVNGNRFYGEDAWVYCQKQISSYVEKPGILEGNPPGACKSRTPTHYEWMKRFTKAVQRQIEAVDLQRRRVDAASTFAFGIGLGLHLFPLIAETRCREIIIVEPEPIFLKLSMYFCNWKKIFQTLDKRVVFILNRDAESIFQNCRIHINARNPGIQQCAFYYQHYWEETMNSIVSTFLQKVPLFFDGLGYYDDEKIMLRNHLLNMYMDEWVMCHSPEENHSVTAVIVGAGPSLAKDMQWLKETQERVVIFSGGSSLQALLKEGILPDFHVEIENVAMNYDILSPLFQEYDLSRTILIASSTMDARSARLFKRRMWFMREGVMATAAYGRVEYALYYQNPTVVNTALTSAMSLGFRECLLLGADFGTKDAQKHHVPGTSYETFEELKKVEFAFPDTMKANFGGQCYTNYHLQSGITSLKNLIEFYKTSKIYNGSDGAAIPKTIPIKLSRYQPFLLQDMEKAGFVNHLFETSDKIDWKEVYGEKIFSIVDDDFAENISRITKIIKKFSKKRKDFILFLYDFYYEMVASDHEQSKINPAITGTFASITITMVHWWRRSYEDDCQKMEKICRRYWYVLLNILSKDFKKFIESVRQELPLVRPDLFDDKPKLGER